MQGHDPRPRRVLSHQDAAGARRRRQKFEGGGGPASDGQAGSTEDMRVLRVGMLSVHDVSQSYGGKLLFDNVNVTFSPGRRFGLTGPNGAGKSTFMRFLAGDAEPQKGSVSRPKKTSILRQDQ